MTESTARLTGLGEDGHPIEPDQSPSHSHARVSSGSNEDFRFISSGEEQDIPAGSPNRGSFRDRNHAPFPYPRQGDTFTGPTLRPSDYRTRSDYNNRLPRPHRGRLEQSIWETYSPNENRDSRQSRPLEGLHRNRSPYRSHGDVPQASFNRTSFGSPDNLRYSQGPGISSGLYGSLIHRSTDLDVVPQYDGFPPQNHPPHPMLYPPPSLPPYTQQHLLHESPPNAQQEYASYDPYHSTLQSRRYSPPYHSSYPPQQASSYRPRPHHHPKNTLQNNARSHEDDSDRGHFDGSSYENEKDWIDADLAESESSSPPDFLLSSMKTSQTVQIQSNARNDDDLLNPADWMRKLHVIEKNVRENHLSRSQWPDTWRHPDNKAYPKILLDVWPEFAIVDFLVSKLGLGAVLPTVDGQEYKSKPQGTLFTVVEAYKARHLPKTDSTIPPLPKFSSSAQTSDDWDGNFELVQRLLQARDYLVAVCRDAEFLNEIHPSMDAITWFEQAEAMDKKGVRRIRKHVVELMSVSLSHLADIMKSLNGILQALLWGWSTEGTICIRPDPEIMDRLLIPPKGVFRKLTFQSAQMSINSNRQYENGERRIQTCLHTLGCGLRTLVNEVEVFAAMLSQALFYQCDAHIWDLEDRYSSEVSYGHRNISGLYFIPRTLSCMGTLIQDREIRVLTQTYSAEGYNSYVSPIPEEVLPTPPSLKTSLYMRTTIRDLARIWGPIWTATSFEYEHAWIWYRLPGGYIGAPQTYESKVDLEADESSCHFSTVEHHFGKCPSPQFYVPEFPYLLIGHGLPATLVHQEPCKIGSQTGLEGMALQSIGTLKPFKYKESSTLNLTLGHSGIQASWSTQIKTNPGIRMKESLLQRWKLEPCFRNPRLLLLWYGVEVSLCTRNARRCRIIDLLRSSAVIRYLSTIYRPEIGSSAYINALFDALKSKDPMAFIKLYDLHPEWHVKLGTVVARCLDFLKDSGVNRNGDLAAFVFIKKFHDPEQLAILSKNYHTWIGILKDSIDIATFAVVSDRCLEYPVAPGQNCRRKNRSAQGSKTVLETSYIPTDRSDIGTLFRLMNENDRLQMQNSSKFKIKRRSSKGIILGTWQKRYLPHLDILRRSEVRYMERRQDGEKSIKAFLVSDKAQKLARLRVTPMREPSQIDFGKEIMDKHDYEQSRSSSTSTPSSSDQSSNAATSIPTCTKSSESVAENPSPSFKNDTMSRTDGSSNINFTRDAHSREITDGLISSQGKTVLNRIDKGTQTDQPDRPIIHQQHSSTAGSIKRSEKTLSPLLDEASANDSSRSKKDASHSRHKSRRYRRGSDLEDEINISSSHRRHRHRSSKDEIRSSRVYKV